MHVGVLNHGPPYYLSVFDGLDCLERTPCSVLLGQERPDLPHSGGELWKVASASTLIWSSWFSFGASALNHTWCLQPRDNFFSTLLREGAPRLMPVLVIGAVPWVRCMGRGFGLSHQLVLFISIRPSLPHPEVLGACGEFYDTEWSVSNSPHCQLGIQLSQIYEVHYYGTICFPASNSSVSFSSAALLVLVAL